MGHPPAHSPRAMEHLCGRRAEQGSRRRKVDISGISARVKNGDKEGKEFLKGKEVEP